MAQRDLSLSFVCPVCEAACMERCHVKVGVICFESHWERKDLATNAVLDALANGRVIAFPTPDPSHRRWAS